MTNSIAILGAQWGDEGKVKLIYLQKCDIVVRFQGVIARRTHSCCR